MRQRFLAAENFELAWDKVATNRGCAGVDRETIAEFGAHKQAALSRLRRSVVNVTYRPLPLRQLFVPKSAGGWRELNIPAVRDRIVQQALLQVLHPVMEPQFELLALPIAWSIALDGSTTGRPMARSGL